jgi:hypothetical protein
VFKETIAVYCWESYKYETHKNTVGNMKNIFILKQVGHIVTKVLLREQKINEKTPQTLHGNDISSFHGLLGYYYTYHMLWWIVTKVSEEPTDSISWKKWSRYRMDEYWCTYHIAVHAKSA